MPRLTTLQAKNVIQVLKRLGFVEDKQKGSHVVMFNAATGARTIIPIHPGRNLKRGLMFAILKEARITPEEFLKML